MDGPKRNKSADDKQKKHTLMRSLLVKFCLVFRLTVVEAMIHFFLLSCKWNHSRHIKFNRLCTVLNSYATKTIFNLLDNRLIGTFLVSHAVLRQWCKHRRH